MHPNIRYLYKDYWDFFDHHIPLTDKSIAEGLEVVGFEVEMAIDRFLPFTTKSRIPKKCFPGKLIAGFQNVSPVSWWISPGARMFPR